MIKSMYVPMGTATAIVEVPVGTIVLQVEIDFVAASFVMNGNFMVVDLPADEGAHHLQVTTNTSVWTAVLSIYDNAQFIPMENGERFAKIITSHPDISFNESIARSKIFIPAQVAKTFWGLPLRRRDFASIDFVPVSQMIQLGHVGAPFNPSLSMRMKYTVPVPFNPARNKVTLRRYTGTWDTVDYNEITDRYVEFTPDIPALYVAGIPKPLGVTEQMRRIPSRMVPIQHPGRTFGGTP